MADWLLIGASLKFPIDAFSNSSLLLAQFSSESYETQAYRTKSCVFNGSESDRDTNPGVCLTSFNTSQREIVTGNAFR